MNAAAIAAEYGTPASPETTLREGSVWTTDTQGEPVNLMAHVVAVHGVTADGGCSLCRKALALADEEAPKDRQTSPNLGGSASPETTLREALDRLADRVDTFCPQECEVIDGRRSFRNNAHEDQECLDSIHVAADEIRALATEEAQHG